MRVLLVACYELGHQPLAVAAPAARLRARSHDVRCLDLSVQPFDPDLVAWAERVALSVPMHTATRLAKDTIAAIRLRRGDLPICCFGLYAAMTAGVADACLAGETDDALAAWVEEPEPLQAGPVTPVVLLGRAAARPGAPVPARDLLPDLAQYARLRVDGEERLVAHVEASHGCAHRCRHCPVPVVYDGRIRIVDAEAVLADVAQQVELGARHVTFGDPDFLNGVHHSTRVARELHRRWPDLTWDCTTKVEHVLRHRELWDELAALGCLFVVSAFETVDDALLTRLAKGHTAADAADAVDLLHARGITVRPSWLPFTPWTTPADVAAILEFVAEHDLVGAVDPVQYTIRLLLPAGSLLLRDPDLSPQLGPYDDELGSYRWSAPDPGLDELQARLADLVEQATADRTPIGETFDAVRVACGLAPVHPDPSVERVPGLTEAWFCCAEPTSGQRRGLAGCAGATGAAAR